MVCASVAIGQQPPWLGDCYHIGQIGKKIEKPLHHQYPGLDSKTTTDQGGVNAPLMSIELATIGRVVVTLANWAMANIGEKCAKLLYVYGLNINAVMEIFKRTPVLLVHFGPNVYLK